MKSDSELYRLLVRTAGMARRTSNGKEKPGDPPKKWQGYGYILDTLVPGEGMSQQQLASALCIRPQSISEALSVMEERELVRRQPSDKEKRVMLVFLTQKGVERRAELAEERAYKAEHFLACLDKEEKQTLYSLLLKLFEKSEVE